MKNKKFKFKVGESTKDIWCGDIVTECEFLMDLGHGQMLFYDVKDKSFRKVFIEVNDKGIPYMNGWDCASRPSKLI
jgi:hypothetical protein